MKGTGRDSGRVGSAKSDYCARTADHQARARPKMPRHDRCMSRFDLVTGVDEKLRSDWSPVQIAGRIRLDYSEGSNHAHQRESIYRWIYAAAQPGDTSHRHLRRAYRRRRRQSRYDRGEAGCPGVSIWPGGRSLLPAKPALGSGGGFGLCCRRPGSAAQLQGAHKSVLVLTRLENKTAAASGEALVPRLCELPPELRQTLTLDNGSEKAGFRELERTGLTRLLVQATFALAARQQRERRWPLATVLPKGHQLAQDHGRLLRNIAKRLNERPRKWSTYQTSVEVFNLALTGALAI